MVHALRCLFVKIKDVENGVEIDISGESPETELLGITSKLERILRVNNTLVDNEFRGTDLAVSLIWKKVGFWEFE